MTKPRVAFVGMTHLGLCSAVASASKGFATFGFDPDVATIEALRAGRLPVAEPDLAETIAANAKRLSFGADPAELARADLIYVAPDVATDDQGRSDTAQLERLLAITAARARDDATIVVLSQVSPGFTRRHAATRGNFYYQVETLIFGRAVERAMRPERFIVGCLAPEAKLPDAFAAFLAAFGCPILKMRYESAELAKIAINFFLIASVGAANTLAELCEGIGADWNEIVPALRLDKRIGAHAYLGAGLGLSGGNLERDMASVLAMAARENTNADIVRAWASNSAHRRDWAWRTLTRELYAAKPDAALGVLGLAYKENTHSTKNAPSFALLAKLAGRRVAAFDPMVPASAAPVALRAAASALDCAQDADAVALMTPWPEFRDIDPAALARAMSGRLVLDPYRLLDGAKCRDAGLRRIVLGAPPGES